ncbi:MAG: hypothetical protein HYV09_09935 [Deltaproteobacteria bacterium]|nr:hypothetical protein [Deltaproteobacteria bacterium]
MRGAARVMLLSLSVLAGACSSSEDGGSTPADAAGEACLGFDAGPAYEAPPAVEVDPFDEDATVEDTAPPDVGPPVSRAEIDDIISGSCSFSSCHGTRPGSGGLYLAPPPSNWVVELANKPSTLHPTMKRVVPGDPTRSFLVQKLGPGLCALDKECASGSCGDRMPKGAPPLSAADVAKIVAWIRQGASES